MLNFYLTTVLIWFIIVFASVTIADPFSKQKCIKSNFQGNFIRDCFYSFLIAIVPVARLIVVVKIIALVFNKKKEDNQ